MEMDWLEEVFEKLINTTRVRVLNRDDKDVNKAVSKWLASVDRVIQEMNNVDEEKKTSDWCERLFKRIHVLDEMEKSDFTEDAHLIALFLKLNHKQTKSFPLFKRQYIQLDSDSIKGSSRVKSPPSKAESTCCFIWIEVLFQKFRPQKYEFPDEKSTSIHGELLSSTSMEEAQEDDTCAKTTSHSPDEKSTSTHVELLSSTSMEEARKDDDTFQGLQPSSSSGDFKYLASTYQAKNYLFEALQDDIYHSIGLFGHRGCGKTALVNAAMLEFKNIFGLVLFVNVFEKTDIAELQNQIAPQLNLKFQAVMGKFKRATAIKSALSKCEGKVLVIFDNVLTNFDPQDIEDIGIPDPGKKCKILLITHDKKYCNKITCHPWIPLRPLSGEDAWKLLQQYSGIDHDSPRDLFDVAREVSFQCKGLPRVIEDVVSSLHNRNTKHWRETLDCLKHSTARHQIFISFRGKDTRDDFTASLFDALIQGGFKVYKDDEQLRSGDTVSEALIKAIEQSRCSIVVLSENYAESSWCLDELVKILKCREKTKQLVLPIFCKVDPSNVRHLKGSFGQTMNKKKERFQKDKIQEWTSALFKVAGLPRKDYKTGSQLVFIKEIVQYVRDNKHRLHIV